MSHTPHDLVEEFPWDSEKLRALTQSDAHFKQLADRYHEINSAIHRAETNLEPTDQLHESEMRKERLVLKDEIARILAADA